jgi:hypothetical protein
MEGHLSDVFARRAEVQARVRIRRCSCERCRSRYRRIDSVFKGHGQLVTPFSFIKIYSMFDYLIVGAGFRVRLLPAFGVATRQEMFGR